MIPLGSGIFDFPALNRETFHGLPGLLADSLPDRYGNRLIDVWLERQGRAPGDFTPVERLCYMSTRAMGALELSPHSGRCRASPFRSRWQNSRNWLLKFYGIGPTGLCISKARRRKRRMPSSASAHRRAAIGPRR